MYRIKATRVRGRARQAGGKESQFMEVVYYQPSHGITKKMQPFAWSHSISSRQAKWIHHTREWERKQRALICWLFPISFYWSEFSSVF